MNKNFFSNGQIIEAIQNDNNHMVEDLDDDEVSHNEQPKTMITNEMKDTILKYLELDMFIEEKKDNIKKINVEIKEIKVKNQVNEAKIIEYLSQLGETLIDLNTRNEQITKVTTKTKGPIKPEYIRTTLIEHLKNDDAAKLLLEDIEKKRQVKVTEKLVRKKIGEKTKG